MSASDEKEDMRGRAHLESTFWRRGVN